MRPCTDHLKRELDRCQEFLGKMSSELEPRVQARLNEAVAYATKAFDGAAHVVRLNLINNRLIGAAIEPRSNRRRHTMRNRRPRRSLSRPRNSALPTWHRLRAKSRHSSRHLNR